MIRYAEYDHEKIRNVEYAQHTLTIREGQVHYYKTAARTKPTCHRCVALVLSKMLVNM